MTVAAPQVRDLQHPGVGNAGLAVQLELALQTEARHAVGARDNLQAVVVERFDEREHLGP